MFRYIRLNRVSLLDASEEDTRLFIPITYIRLVLCPCNVILKGELTCSFKRCRVGNLISQRHFNAAHVSKSSSCRLVARQRPRLRGVAVIRLRLCV